MYKSSQYTSNRSAKNCPIYLYPTGFLYISSLFEPAFCPKGAKFRPAGYNLFKIPLIRHRNDDDFWIWIGYDKIWKFWIYIHILYPNLKKDIYPYHISDFWIYIRDIYPLDIYPTQACDKVILPHSTFYEILYDQIFIRQGGVYHG